MAAAEQMAKSDRDLFERLRSAGLRKQVARTLSEIGDGAGKKATSAARGAVQELRSLADEIERRLPRESARRAGNGRSASASGRARQGGRGAASARGAGPKPARSAASSAAPRTGTSAAPRTGTSAAPRTRTSAAPRTRTSGAPRARASAGATAARVPAPRGQNKAKILQALAAGPKTAADVARETGIATGTASTTLNKLARSGEIVKAPRGYALPGGRAGSGGTAAA
jgi:CRP-like cAMP-binding protein